MKKLLFISAAILFSNTAHAAYLHWQGNTFLDNGVSVKFPCSHGGEPLVIYSTPINNTALISSLDPIYPIYVKTGYNADLLTIDSISQNQATSTQNLIVENYNPASGAIHFGLSRSDGQTFFVNTINFAAINATATSHYVSSFVVNVDQQPYVETVIPETMPNFIEDQGFDILAALHSIQGVQYSWNQRGAWHTYSSRHGDPIPYDFTPQSTVNGQYAGYGFWVCGQDQPPTILPAGAAPKVAYADKI